MSPISRVQFDYYGKPVCFVDGRDTDSIARGVNARPRPRVARGPVDSAETVCPPAVGRQLFNLDACFEMPAPLDLDAVRA